MTERDAAETNGSTDSEGAAIDDADEPLENGFEAENGTEPEATDAVENAESAEPVEPAESVEPAGDDLTERVAEASDEQVAAEIRNLRELVADLETRLESEAETGTEAEERVADLESKLARKRADFENFKKRMDRRRAEERERATEDLVSRLLGVRDDLVRALSQKADAEIRGGVESTLGELDRVLDDEGVSEISPEPGTEIDPGRHEVMVRVDSDEPEETIAEVFRPGYEMGGKVLRPAQVTISDGSRADDEADG